MNCRFNRMPIKDNDDFKHKHIYIYIYIRKLFNTIFYKFLLYCQWRNARTEKYVLSVGTDEQQSC